MEERVCALSTVMSHMAGLLELQHAAVLQIAGLLDRMALTAEATADGSAVRVQVPPTRSDVLHACDVFEVCAASSSCIARSGSP